MATRKEQTKQGNEYGDMEKQARNAEKLKLRYHKTGKDQQTNPVKSK